MIAENVSVYTQSWQALVVEGSARAQWAKRPAGNFDTSIRGHRVPTLHVCISAGAPRLALFESLP